MTNRDIDALRRYHELTKHSVARLQANRHFLDWEIQPRPFKIYSTLPPIALPEELGVSPVPGVSALLSPGADVAGDVVPDLRALARLLYFTAGVTRRKVYPGGQEQYFRAAACTGALYHIDVYAVCGPLSGLAPGVYHFGPHDFSLRRLRAGDYRGRLIQATAEEPAVRAAPVVFVLASTFWRNAWKYQSRAYRHCFWDSGTMLANMLAVAATDGIPLRIVLGFVDDQIHHLLGLDGEREAALALVAVGRDTASTAPGPPPDEPPLSYETAPLSIREVEYPAIPAAHAESSLRSPDEVRAWRRPWTAPSPPAAGPTFPLRQLGDPPAEPIESVIRRRGSTRRFARRPIAFEQLSTLLRCASVPAPSDVGTSAVALADVYLIVHAVDGLPPGSYSHRRDEDALELLKEGAFRREAGYLGLGQELPAEASANLYWLSDLDAVMQQLGNRGYRAAQLGAAIAGGKVYLGAYALKLGATGLTFFDDDVTEFFSPHAGGKSVMFLMAAGRGVRPA